MPESLLNFLFMKCGFEVFLQSALMFLEMKSSMLKLGNIFRPPLHIFRCIPKGAPVKLNLPPFKKTAEAISSQRPLRLL